MVTYALPVEVIEDSVLSSFREAELKFESELWRKLWWRRLSPLMSMTLGN